MGMFDANSNVIANNGLIAVLNVDLGQTMEPASGRYCWPLDSSTALIRGSEFKWSPAVQYLTGDAVVVGSDGVMRLAVTTDKNVYLVVRGKEWQDAQLVCSIVDGVFPVATNCFADGQMASLAIGDKVVADTVEPGKLRKATPAEITAGNVQFIVELKDYNPLTVLPGATTAKKIVLRRI